MERSASFAARSQQARSTIDSARSPMPAACDARLRRQASVNVRSRSATVVPDIDARDRLADLLRDRPVARQRVRVAHRRPRSERTRTSANSRVCMIHSPKMTGAGSCAWMVMTSTAVMVASLSGPPRRWSPTPLGHEAAVDGEVLAGDEAGAVAGQEHSRLRDVLRLPDPTQRVECAVLAHVGLDRRRPPRARDPDHLRIDGAGADGHDPDALGRVVEGHVRG